MIATSMQVQRRRLVPAELRRRELEPGQRRQHSRAIGLFAGSIVLGAAFVLKMSLLLPAAPVVALGAYAADRFMVARASRGQTAVAMTVTPWGVLTDEPLRWSSIEWIGHTELARPQLQLRRSPDDEQRSWSLLTVRARGAELTGECILEPALDVLDVLLAPYALDGSRPLALTFDDREGPSVAPHQPGAARDVLAAARGLLQTEAGKELIEVSAEGYRASRMTVRPGTEGLLDRYLVEAPAGTDRGALAAALAGELELVGLVDRLCELVTSPNPVVAGVAKAAALRLGAHRARAGRIDELHPFLDAGDIAALEAWSSERREPPRET